MQMAATKVWTLEELHSLPDDGNKYELIHGELFVTPAPSPRHERLADSLHAILQPYVTAHRLGQIQRPRAVIVIRGSEVEPDLMVRPEQRPIPTDWEHAVLPILVVEIASDATRRRDRTQKHDWYREVEIPEYWMIDGDDRSVRVARPGREDLVERDRVEWQPTGAKEGLVIQLKTYFAEALD